MGCLAGSWLPEIAVRMWMESCLRREFPALAYASLKPVTQLIFTLALVLAAFSLPTAAALREPVHPRRNVEEFAPVEAKFLRFTIRATNRGEPCLDELEVYAAEGLARNVALAANGARAQASGSMQGYGIHQLEGINDGRYGNGRSWIADRIDGAWVQIEFPLPTRINKVVWGRDREGNFIDRLATQYEIQVATDTNIWRTVASSADREPLPAEAKSISGASITRSLVNRFAPVGTTLSVEAGQASSDYRIDVWQTADGLPGNTITAIEQTSDGYLWIGTLNGLARFDGLRFQVFGEASELPNTRVLCLLAGREGTLWIGTEGGGLIGLRDGRSRSLTRLDGLRSDTVTTLAQDRSGQVWAGTPAGLSCWREDKFVQPTALGPPSGSSILVTCVDGSNTLWAVADNQLLTRSSEGPLAKPRGFDPSSFSSVLAAEAGRSGQLWFGGVNGYIGAVSNETVRVYREQPGQLLEAIWALRETRNGDLWAGTANGGLRRLRHGHFTSLTTQEGLSDNSVRCLFEDSEGSLWVGTAGGGLNRVKPRKLTTFTTRDGLAHNVVMSLAEDLEGTLWIGSNCGGLSARRNGVLAPYYANYLLDNECIWSLLSGRDGSLWAGTWGGGLFQMRGREVKNFPVARPGNDEPVVALCEDGHGGLWMGTMQGGLKSFRDGNVSDAQPSKGKPVHPVTALVQEAREGLWVGTSGGGLQLLERGRLTTFGRRDGLPSDFIRALHRDANGVLWIGTGGGLARMQEGKIASFTRSQGLPDEVISQILEDDRTNLWFGCNQGIFRVAAREFEAIAGGKASRVNAISYGRAEGMESLECTGGFYPAGLKTRDGNLWFSTVKGLVMVDPHNISVNEKPPPVVVEQVLTDGMEVPMANTAGSALEFGPGVQRVEFRFTALSLVAPERNRFKHRLDGLEKDWVEAETQRVAAYPHLPPGRYIFRVKACNNDGVWNEAGASIRFSVRPHFWQSRWFDASALIVFLGVGGLMVRLTAVRRLRRKLQRVLEQHSVEQERTRIARDIHDELGANLTRIALLTEVGQKHRHKPEEVSANLSQISVTAREAVRAMDAIVWAVNPRNDSLDNFANYVSQFAEEFFRPTSIRCRLDIPADLPEHPLSTETRHHLFLAVKEALHNVVQHSSASEVWLRLRMDEGELKINIADNGKGIAASFGQGGGHDGLVNIRRRIEDLGGSFDLKSDPSSGTSLLLHLPLPKTGKAWGS